MGSLIVWPRIPRTQSQRFHLAVGKTDVRDRDTPAILPQRIQNLRAALIQRAVRPRDMRKFPDGSIPSITASQHGTAKEKPEIIVDLPTIGLNGPTAPLPRQPELVPRADVTGP